MLPEWISNRICDRPLVPLAGMNISPPPLYRWFRQGLRNPATRSWVVAGVLIYLISPIDIIPSFFPGVGEIDDVVLLGLLLSELAQIWLGHWFAPPAEMDAAAPAGATGPQPTGADKPPNQAVVDVDAVAVED
ncbi:YkvA family protein [Synechococcus sp. PCC 7336]|uniref:YkvA family protein n=1 Tax=Synechococcus sp. PCC 7336 TaxID=195250 RepID=UPI0003460C93|nr:DUF1232 domain-containing protein [Synechococcus sp. PCC 7336]